MSGILISLRLAHIDCSMSLNLRCIRLVRGCETGSHSTVKDVELGGSSRLRINDRQITTIAKDDETQQSIKQKTAKHSTHDMAPQEFL